LLEIWGNKFEDPRQHWAKCFSPAFDPTRRRQSAANAATPTELGGVSLHLKDGAFPNWYLIPKLQALRPLGFNQNGLHHTLAAML
jgi:hypothetical protein